MDFTYFNPNSQSEADFVRNFVARNKTLDYFLRQIKLVPWHGITNHYLIIAPRGFGKTSLLRRVSIGIRAHKDLSSRFIALRFREEQHNVISLDVFWRNCLQSLAEAREDELASSEELAKLDSAWEAYPPRQTLSQDDQDGEPAWQEFLSHCERLNRRPLLLIDNLDTLLDGLSERNQWGLRRCLQRDDGPLVIAASSRYPAAIHNHHAPFYDFFRIHLLDKLEDSEVFACLRNLALRRGVSGHSVLELLNKDPGRVAALNTLAGGNPRTLSVLYGVLESHMSADVLSQLTAMLDTFTGWYQARTEDLPSQQRAVFDALALNWDPMTAAALGQATGLDTPVVSSQLSRLEKSGYAEAVSLSKRGKGRKGYQVSERFFNIWYLMRNGPRRAKQSIRFLTTFLQTCFSSSERRSLAMNALKANAPDPGYSLALASCIRAGQLRHQLLEQAYLRSNEIGQNDEYGPLIDDLRKVSRNVNGVNQSSSNMESISDQIKIFDEIIEIYNSATDLQDVEKLSKALIGKVLVLYRAGDEDGAIALGDEVLKRFDKNESPSLVEVLIGVLMLKGAIYIKNGQMLDALAQYDIVLAKAQKNFSNLVLKQVIETYLARGFIFEKLKDSASEIQSYDALIEALSNDIDGKFDHSYARALFNKAVTLGGIGDSENEILIYENIIERFLNSEDTEVQAWVGKAFFNKAFTFSNLEKYEEEMEVYDKLIEKYSNSSDSKLREIFVRGLFYKAITLGSLGKFFEEIQIYDDLLIQFDDAAENEIQEHLIKALVNKAYRLHNDRKYEQEVEAYDQALRLIQKRPVPLLIDYKPTILLSKALSLGKMGNKAGERKIYSQIFRYYRTSTNPEHLDCALRAIFNKAISYGEDSRLKKEIETYDRLINDFANSDVELTEEYVAKSLVNKAVKLSSLGRVDESLAILDAVIASYLTASNHVLLLNGCMALFAKGVLLTERGMTEEAISIYENLTREFGDFEPAQEQVAKAMVNKAVCLGKMGKVEQELYEYDKIIKRFMNSTETVVQDCALDSLEYKVESYKLLGQMENELSTLNLIIETCEKIVNPSSDRRIAHAIYVKSLLMEMAGKPEQKVKLLDELIKRFSTNNNDVVIKIVIGAYFNKAVWLRDCGLINESKATFISAITWNEMAPNFHIGFGNLLLDFIGDVKNALKAYEHGLLISKESEDIAVLRANIAYAQGLYLDELENSRKSAELALADGCSISSAGRYLLRALPVWGDVTNHWESVYENIGLAITSDDPKLWSSFEDDLQRLLSFIIHNGRGEEFIKWMSFRDYAKLYSPLYHAFVATFNGDDHLLTINPEARKIALDIYEGISRNLRLLELWSNSKKLEPLNDDLKHVFKSPEKSLSETRP